MRIDRVNAQSLREGDKKNMVKFNNWQCEKGKTDDFTSWYLTIALSRLPIKWYTNPRNPRAIECRESSSNTFWYVTRASSNLLRGRFEILGIWVKVLLTVIFGNMFPGWCMLLPSSFENSASLEQDPMRLGTSLQPSRNYLDTKPR